MVVEGVVGLEEEIGQRRYSLTIKYLYRGCPRMLRRTTYRSSSALLEQLRMTEKPENRESFSILTGIQENLRVKEPSLLRILRLPSRLFNGLMERNLILVGL